LTSAADRYALGIAHGVSLVKAVNRALNDEESRVRVTIPAVVARFAFARSH
jgi:hypothetical protein